MTDHIEAPVNWKALAEEMGMTEEEARETFESGWKRKPLTLEDLEIATGMRGKKPDSKTIKEKSIKLKT